MEPIALYELLAERDAPLLHEKVDRNRRYEEAFSHYQHGDWDEAFAGFSVLAAEYPDDKAVRLMMSRLEKTRTVKGKGRRPPAGWDGATTLNGV